MTQEVNFYENCRLCPRACGVNRTKETGFCGAGTQPRLAKAMLHFWEEPVLCGNGGSGAVFFSGCTMKCVFCQNYEISAQGFGREISVRSLADVFLSLEEQGAQNIDLITASHYLPSVLAALDLVRHRLSIPIVYNCGGYESVDTLRMLSGYVDIYLPDVKYFDDRLALTYSAAPHYFDTACAALEEMLRQTGKPILLSGPHAVESLANRPTEQEPEAEGQFPPQTGNPILLSESHALEHPTRTLATQDFAIQGQLSRRTEGPISVPDHHAEKPHRNLPPVRDFNTMGQMVRGVLVRHMVLPCHRADSIAVLGHLAAQFGTDRFLISLLRQYTPFYLAKSDPALEHLNRRITSFEYDSVVKEALRLGFPGFIQEKSSAKEEYTPLFDLQGVPEEERNRGCHIL